MKSFDLEYMLDPKPRHRRSMDAFPVGEEMGLLERLVAQTRGFDELVELLRQSPNGRYYAFAIAAVMRQHGPFMQRRVHAAVKGLQANRTTAFRGDDDALDGGGGSGGEGFGVHTHRPARRVAATIPETAVPESIDEVHPGLRALMERVTGQSLGLVRVRRGDRQLSGGRQAQADGELIRLAPGVEPQSPSGLKTLIHETVHVLQQRVVTPRGDHGTTEHTRRAEAEAVQVTKAALAGRRHPVVAWAPSGLGFTEVVESAQRLWEVTETELGGPSRAFAKEGEAPASNDSGKIDADKTDADKTHEEGDGKSGEATKPGDLLPDKEPESSEPKSGADKAVDEAKTSGEEAVVQASQERPVVVAPSGGGSHGGGSTGGAEGSDAKISSSKASKGGVAENSSAANTTHGGGGGAENSDGAGKESNADKASSADKAGARREAEAGAKAIAQATSTAFESPPSTDAGSAPTTPLEGDTDLERADRAKARFERAVHIHKQSAQEHTHKDEGERTLEPDTDPLDGSDPELVGVEIPEFDAEAHVDRERAERIVDADNASEPLESLIYLEPETLAQYLDSDTAQAPEAHRDKALANRKAKEEAIEKARDKADAERTALRDKASSLVRDAQRRWRQTQEKLCDRHKKTAEKVVGDKKREASARQKKANKDSDVVLRDAETKAKALGDKAKAEADKKAEGAKENKQHWIERGIDWIKEKVNVVKESIGALLAAARKAIADLLARAKEAAEEIIDAAVDFIAACLTFVEETLDNLLELLPEEFEAIAERFKAEIKGLLEEAKSQLNMWAEGLKERLTQGLKELEAFLTEAFDIFEELLGHFLEGLNALLEMDVLSWLRETFPELATLLDEGWDSLLETLGDSIGEKLKSTLEELRLDGLYESLVHLKDTLTNPDLVAGVAGGCCDCFSQMLGAFTEVFRALLATPAAEAYKEQWADDAALDHEERLQELFEFLEGVHETFKPIYRIYVRLEALYNRVAINLRAVWMAVALALGLNPFLSPLETLKKMLGELLDPFKERLKKAYLALKRDSPLAPFFALLDKAEALYKEFNSAWEAFKDDPAQWLATKLDALAHLILPAMAELLGGLDAMLAAAAGALEAMASMMEESAGMFEGLAAGIAWLREAVQAAARYLRSVIRPFTRALRDLKQALTELSGALSSFYTGYIKPLLDVLVGLVQCVLLPPPLNLVQFGAFLTANLFIHAIPDCYKTAICEFLVDLAIVAVDFMPEPVDTDLLGIMLKHGLSGFLGELKSQVQTQEGQAKLAEIFNTLASFVGGNLDLVLGFLYGVGMGLWDATVGTLTFILDIALLPAKAVLWLVSRPLVWQWEAYKAIDDWAEDREGESKAEGVTVEVSAVDLIDQPLGDAAASEPTEVEVGDDEGKTSADKTPSERTEDKPPREGTVGEALDPPPSALESLVTEGLAAFRKTFAEGLTNEELRQLVELGGKALGEHASVMGRTAAQLLIDMMGVATPFVLGQALGEIASFIVVEIVLALLVAPSLGLSELVNIPLVLQKLKRIKGAAKAFAATGKIVDRIAGALRPTLQKLSNMDNAIGRWAKSAEQELDDVVRWVKDGEKKVSKADKNGDDIKDQDGKDQDTTGGKEKAGDKDKDSDNSRSGKPRGKRDKDKDGSGRRKPSLQKVAEVARKAARAGWRDLKGDTLTKVLDRRGAERELDPMLLKPPSIKVEFTVVGRGSSWKVRAKATHRLRRVWATYEMGQGWMAASEDGKPFFTAKDRTQEHKEAIEQGEKKLQKDTAKVTDAGSGEGGGEPEARAFARAKRSVEEFAKHPKPKLIEGITLTNKTQTQSKAEGLARRHDVEGGFAFNVVIAPNARRGVLRSKKRTLTFEKAFNAATDKRHKEMREENWAVRLRQAKPVFRFGWERQAQSRLNKGRKASRSHAESLYPNLTDGKQDEELLEHLSKGTPQGKSLRSAFHEGVLKPLHKEILVRIKESSYPYLARDSALRKHLKDRIELDLPTKQVRARIVDDLGRFEVRIEARYAQMNNAWIRGQIKGYQPKEALEHFDWSAHGVSKREQAENATFAAVVRTPDPRGKGVDQLLRKKDSDPRKAFHPAFGQDIVDKLKADATFTKHVKDNLEPGTDAARYDLEQGERGGVGKLTLAGALDSVNPRLEASVGVAKYKSETGIVAFMLLLATAKSCGTNADNTVTLSEFSDASSPVGFEYVLNGSTQNKAWVKDRFRAADDGKHEWIPSNYILKVIERAASVSDATEAARWIYAQHLLRTETSAIIFKPGDYQEAFDAVRNNDVDAMNNIIATFKASKLQLRGHVGALYINDTNNDHDPLPQKIGEADWHGELRAAFDSNTTLLGVLNGCLQIIEGSPGKPGTVWNGELRFLPNKLRAMADKLESDYTNATGIRLHKTLADLAGAQRDNYRKIVVMFNKAIKELTRL